MFYIKLHVSQFKSLLAVCDSDLIGRKFSEGSMRLNISKSFFKGELVNEERAVLEMKKAGSLNIVGNKAIELAIKGGVVEKENLIEGIPFALVFEVE